MTNNLLLMYALALARRGYQRVFQNPPVGAVIVKNKKIISTGFHQEIGMLHAEAVAISKLSPKMLKDSTLYVSLEPCSHFGKTPPCTEAICKAEISEVIYGCSDLTSEAGGGGNYLSNKGIKTWLAQSAICQDFIRPWEDFKLHNKKTIDFWALASLDGKILRCHTSIYHEKSMLADATERFSKRLKKNVQCDLEIVGSDLESGYHFLAPLLDFKKYLSNNCVKRLHLMRVPIITSKDDDNWEEIDFIGELSFQSAMRFGSACYERYNISF